ncbi:MAG: hypothetical protein ACLP8S_31990 [Solirubrobacteraceae bacterium]|jgi:hypothetical protein
MSTSPPPPSEAELRAYEDEIKRIRVEHVLFDNLVTMINLGMRRTGLMAGTEGERDASQVRLAIEAVRAHIPLVESVAPEQAAPIRDALSQLQLAYVRVGGQGAPAESAAAAASSPPPSPPPDDRERQAGTAQGAPTAGGSGTPASQPAPGAPPPPKPGEPGPAQRSGRLWIPGS